MKTAQIKYRQWTGTEWRYWGFIDGIFVAPIQGIEDSYQLLPFLDKNGNEIWEGNFVKGTYGYIYLVEYFKDCFWLNGGQKGAKWNLRDMHINLKIIGNISENPELLEELKYEN